MSNESYLTYLSIHGESLLAGRERNDLLQEKMVKTRGRINRCPHSAHHPHPVPANISAMSLPLHRLRKTSYSCAALKARLKTHLFNQACYEIHLKLILTPHSTIGSVVISTQVDEKKSKDIQGQKNVQSQTSFRHSLTSSSMRFSSNILPRNRCS